MFSQSELSYASVPVVSDLLKDDQERVRADARLPFDYRDVSLSTRVSAASSSLGSAQCSIGDHTARTSVIAATRAEVEPVSSESEDGAGKIVVSLECSPGALSQLRPDLAVHLSTLLGTIFSNAQSLPNEFLKQLVVVPPREKAWTVYVDVLIESADAGNVIDMAVLAARSALATTLLPSTRPVTYAGDKEGEQAGIGGLVKAGKAGSKAIDFELVDTAQEGVALEGASELPVALTFYLMDGRPVLDATLLEDEASGALMVVAMDGRGRIVAVEQIGQAEVDFMTVKSILKGAPSILRLMLDSANARLQL